MHTQLWRTRLVVSLLVVLSGLLGLPRPSPAHVAEFTCAAGDVACLIEAITQANSTGVASTITLEAGTYTLTAVDNTTDGPNGLPSVTSVVTIQGAGPDATILEREASAPAFRLVHVAATGVLTLEGLTVRGGVVTGGGDTGGGGLFNRGTLRLTRLTVANHQSGFAFGGLVNYGTATIAASTFVRNTAFAGAGGAANEGGTLIITDTTFAGNFSQGASGILNEAGTLILTNSTLMDNGGEGAAGLSNIP
jgi:hypothetical protein